MDNELEAQAIQTFAAVPEIYQQAFKEAGADFPDELVTAIKSDPNKAVELLSTNKDLKQAVISVFQQHKDAIMQYMQQQSSMFKNGGKFDYLRKLQQGGSLEQPKYLADEKPRGLKGWLFQATKYPRQDGQTGYFSEYITPAGDTLTTVGGRWNSWQRVARKGQQPRYQVAVGSDEYRDTIDPEVIEMLKNVHSRFLYPVKKQEGGIVDDNDEGPGLGTLYAGWDSTGMWRGVPKAKRYFIRTKYNTNGYTSGDHYDGKPTIEDKIIGDNMQRYRIINLNSNDTTYYPSKAAFIQGIRSNETFGNKKENWITLDKERMKLRKQGGKLAKENAINKKYIKDSEKAGAKASKEMSDLRDAHRAELKRVRKGQKGFYNLDIDFLDDNGSREFKETFPNGVTRNIRLVAPYDKLKGYRDTTLGDGTRFWPSPFNPVTKQPTMSKDAWNQINSELDSLRDVEALKMLSNPYNLKSSNTNKK